MMIGGIILRTYSEPFLQDSRCPIFFRNMQQSEPQQIYYQQPIYYQQQFQQPYNARCMHYNSQPIPYYTQYPNQYIQHPQSKDSILDEILTSLYMHLPPDVYEDYKNTILECVYENERRKSIVDGNNVTYTDDNKNMVRLFIDSKRVEGLSENTLNKYEYQIMRVLDFLGKRYAEVTSADVRYYLSEYKKTGVSNTSLNNVRLVLSTFYNWLEAEDYILKSPMRRISRIKMDKVIREVITEENMELLRIACRNVRDLAILDTLFSTGARLSEMQQMNIDDINFERHSLIVLGKGSKEREVYLNAKSRVNIRRYLAQREDNNKALWVTLNPPYNRLSNRGIQEILDKIERDAHINQSIHPHMFRRTAATVALQRGMALETIQMMLGHSCIETTMGYVIVDKESVKAAHDRLMN